MGKNKPKKHEAAASEPAPSKPSANRASDAKTQFVAMLSHELVSGLLKVCCTSAHITRDALDWHVSTFFVIEFDQERLPPVAQGRSICHRVGGWQQRWVMRDERLPQLLVYIVMTFRHQLVQRRPKECIERRGCRWRRIATLRTFISRPARSIHPSPAHESLPRGINHKKRSGREND